MGRIRIVVGAGLAAIIVALVLTLSGSPIAVAGMNYTTPASLGEFKTTTRACQSGEVLPRGTTAIRLHAFGSIGPRVEVKVLEQGHLIAHGEQSSGWTGGVVTVPVHPLPTTRSGVTLCFAYLLNGYEVVYAVGTLTGSAEAAHGGGKTLPGRLGVEYLRPGVTSWWSLAIHVARRMGLGNAWGGAGCVILILLLMAGVVLLTSRATLRELR
jgi:hypothetical protein